jgi:hypothetical protein
VNPNIVYVSSLNGLDISEFFTRTYKVPEITRDFMVTRLDDRAISDILVKRITEQGITSLLKYSITCDAVYHGGIHVNQIEQALLGFVKRLGQAKNLLIIDPYLYTDEASTLQLFGKMIGELPLLDQVKVVTNGAEKSKRPGMHAIIAAARPSVQIEDIVTSKIHDRFWIDMDNLQGVVIGTSLNGVSKGKLFLVDKLAGIDVQEIIGVVRPLFTT